MDKITRVGVDLAKRVYQLHAVGEGERRVLARPISPARFWDWAATLPQGCVVAMEACSGAHHVARRLLACLSRSASLATVILSPTIKSFIHASKNCVVGHDI